jgi:hypothetical protein
MHQQPPDAVVASTSAAKSSQLSSVSTQLLYAGSVAVSDMLVIVAMPVDLVQHVLRGERSVSEG